MVQMQGVRCLRFRMFIQNLGLSFTFAVFHADVLADESRITLCVLRACLLSSSLNCTLKLRQPHSTAVTFPFAPVGGIALGCWHGVCR